jgi:hypothetical protein
MTTNMLHLKKQNGDRLAAYGGHNSNGVKPLLQEIEQYHRERKWKGFKPIGD